MLPSRLGSGSPGPNNEDNHHHCQRGTNTDYGIDPGRRYLLRRWDVDPDEVRMPGTLYDNLVDQAEDVIEENPDEKK